MAKDNFIEKVAKEFNSVDEMKNYIEAQEKTLVELNRHIIQLENENKNLKTVLDELNVGSGKTDFVVSDEEIICRTQLSLLKNISLERQLTLEESRKVDIYSKILIALNEKPKTIKLETKSLKEEELLAIVGNETE